MIEKLKGFFFINDEFFVFPVIEKIKTKEEYKRLFSNFLSLSILQAANYLFPLITFPYLVRVLGVEKFGLISFAQAFIQYFAIITDYGFNLSATREISINRDNKEKVNEIFSSVMIIKFVLMILSFILMNIIIFSFDKFRQDWLLYYLTFGMILGNVLFPGWFFQGMEQMKWITYLNILTKAIFTVAVFIFIKNQDSYHLVPLLNSSGYIISGILSLFLIHKYFEAEFKIVDYKNIKHQLKEGWHIFISTIAISLYTVSNTFILGIFTNNTIVGYYSVAEKIIRAVQGLYSPISHAIYPYISKLINENKKNGIRMLRKMTILFGGSTFLFSLFVLIFSDKIIRLIAGSIFTESVNVLRILSFLPFIITLSNIFGIHTMLNFNYKGAFSKIIISASFINIFLSLILVPLFQHIGISFAVLISEIFVTLSMFIFLNNKGIRILEGKIV